MKRPQSEVIRWAELLEIERAAKAVLAGSRPVALEDVPGAFVPTDRMNWLREALKVNTPNGEGSHG